MGSHLVMCKQSSSIESESINVQLYMQEKMRNRNRKCQRDQPKGLMEQYSLHQSNMKMKHKIHEDILIDIKHELFMHVSYTFISIISKKLVVKMSSSVLVFLAVFFFFFNYLAVLVYGKHCSHFLQVALGKDGTH